MINNINMTGAAFWQVVNSCWILRKLGTQLAKFHELAVRKKEIIRYKDVKNSRGCDNNKNQVMRFYVTFVFYRLEMKRSFKCVFLPSLFIRAMLVKPADEK